MTTQSKDSALSHATLLVADRIRDLAEAGGSVGSVADALLKFAKVILNVRGSAEVASHWGVWCVRDGITGFWRADVDGNPDVSLKTTREDAERRAHNLNEAQKTRTDSLGWRYEARAYDLEAEALAAWNDESELSPDDYAKIDQARTRVLANIAAEADLGSLVDKRAIILGALRSEFMKRGWGIDSLEGMHLVGAVISVLQSNSHLRTKLSTQKLQHDQSMAQLTTKYDAACTATTKFSDKVKELETETTKAKELASRACTIRDAALKKAAGFEREREHLLFGCAEAYTNLEARDRAGEALAVHQHEWLVAEHRRMSSIIAGATSAYGDLETAIADEISKQLETPEGQAKVEQALIELNETRDELNRKAYGEPGQLEAAVRPIVANSRWGYSGQTRTEACTVRSRLQRCNVWQIAYELDGSTREVVVAETRFRILFPLHISDPI